MISCFLIKNCFLISNNFEQVIRKPTLPNRRECAVCVKPEMQNENSLLPAEMLRWFNCTMHSNKVFSYQQMTRLKTTLSRLLVSTTKQAVNRSTSVNTKYIFSAQHSNNKDEGNTALERKEKYGSISNG